VIGAQNPRVKELRRLIGRRRPSSPLVVLEGPRTVGEALDARITVETVIVPESSLDDEKVAAVRSRLAADVETLVVRDQVFERIAPTVTPQPMLALAERPDPEVPERLGGDDLVLALVDVADPGNTGTLLRVADAAAARCVVVTGGADPWGPKAIRASAGSVLRVPVVTSDSVGPVLGSMREAGATIVAADVRGGVAHDRGALKPPVVIVLGSEAHGLPAEVLDLADETVHIEMPGRAESLNVAMAGTLLAFEARRGSR
jgi:TrmH family RNA methyltransferase